MLKKVTVDIDTDKLHFDPIAFCSWNVEGGVASIVGSGVDAVGPYLMTDREDALDRMPGSGCFSIEPNLPSRPRRWPTPDLSPARSFPFPSAANHTQGCAGSPTHPVCANLPMFRTPVLIWKTSLPEPAGRVTPPCRHFCPGCGDPIQLFANRGQTQHNRRLQIPAIRVALGSEPPQGCPKKPCSHLTRGALGKRESQDARM